MERKHLVFISPGNQSHRVSTVLSANLMMSSVTLMDRSDNNLLYDSQRGPLGIYWNAIKRYTKITFISSAVYYAIILRIPRKRFSYFQMSLEWRKFLHVRQCKVPQILSKLAFLHHYKICSVTVNICIHCCILMSVVDWIYHEINKSTFNKNSNNNRSCTIKCRTLITCIRSSHVTPTLHSTAHHSIARQNSTYYNPLHTSTIKVLTNHFRYTT